MRILPTSTHIITLEQLGFWQRPYEILKAVIDRPSGVLRIGSDRVGKIDIALLYPD